MPRGIPKNRIHNGWFKKGQTPWNKGKYHSEETKKKIGEANKGKYPSGETKQKISKALKGHITSKETREKIGLANKGKKFTEDHKKKLSLAKMGRISPAKGKYWKLTEKTINKRKGNNHYNWRGGISFEPYSIDWTETLRQSIRERDKYICRLCRKLQGDRAHSVHHIDYNKKNCNPDNLITLCGNCNSKVNKDRDYWMDYFQQKYEQ